MQKNLVLLSFCLLLMSSCSKCPECKSCSRTVAPQLLKSVKYVAGPDKEWFTDDDSVYHYHAYRYRADGSKFLTVCSGAGDDGVVCAGDDVVQFYLAHSYDKSDIVSAEKFCNSAGPDEVWFNDDDPFGWEQVYEYEAGRKTQYLREKDGVTIRLMTFEYEGDNIVKDAEYNAPGPDGKWGTDDDVLEKYHSFTFDKNGEKIESREYHVHHAGQGADGKWFTEDDVVSAAMKHINDHGLVKKDIKLIKPGSDGKWFTDDDVLQYYVVHEYSGATE